LTRSACHTKKARTPPAITCGGSTGLLAFQGISGRGNVDGLNDARIEAIATAIHGTTAVLLHLADTVARTSAKQDPDCRTRHMLDAVLHS